MMKKYFSNIFALAALLMAGAAFTACSSEDNSIEQPANPTAPKTYTLTVNASNEAASTRALALDGAKLVASWENGDELTVFNVTKNAALIGSLTASNASGSTATFSGSLTGTIEKDDVLTLSYHQPAGFSAYAAQDGTLAGAAARDFATASVTVASVESGEITTTGDADFETQTAVLKLTLKDDATPTPNLLNATQLKLSATMTLGTPMTQEIATFNLSGNPYSTNGDGILYFALPKASLVAEYVAGKLGDASLASTIATLLPSATLTYTATVGDDTYIATKTNGYTFAAGKYYAGTLTMAKPAPSYDKEMDLSTTSSDVTVPAGEHWLINGYAEDICVTIGNGATVTLNGVEFFMNNPKPCIKCSGDATIIIADGTTNTLTATASDYGGGIQAGPTGKTLTIKGNTGVLNVEINHTGDATAIGAYNRTACGDIVIEGGVINATSQNGAAIGACYEAACGNITISGGTVTAKAGGAGGLPGVGIGGHYDTACGDITITGGTVTATGFYEPGIGGDNICGDITISGGTVKATKGEYASKCIGTDSGTCGTITIGGTVYWDGSNYQNDGGSYLTQSTITYPAP